MRIHTHRGKMSMSAKLIQMGNFRNLQKSTENVINRKFNVVFVEYQQNNIEYSLSSIYLF